MENEILLKEAVKKAAKEFGIEATDRDVVIENSRDPSHGDYATNFAMRYAKKLGKTGPEFAKELSDKINEPIIEKIEVLGPGFINFFLAKASLSSVISKILEQGIDYGKGLDKHYKVNVEFVSANPTGDLHLGHTRIAAIGDCICRLYEKAGYEVTREFYVNDCGNQVEHLGHSLYLRYRELFGESIVLGDDDYHGSDLIDIAKALKEEYGDKFLNGKEEDHKAFFIRYGIDTELKKLRKDLSDFGVRFDVFSYESDVRKKELDKTIEFLKPYTYVLDGATYLKTSDYLDDKDRPIIKSNGLYTYFLPDIAYHYDKLSRGYDLLVDVLGADHHGYINRMKSALVMKGYSKDVLEVKLVQVVKTIRGGEEVKMSKRTGKAITHRDIVSEVGKDAVRYFFVERASTSHLDFDYDLAMSKTKDNPVYYAQYAHARCISVLGLGSDIPLDPLGENLGLENETSILKQLADFPSIIESAAKSRSPYKIALYIQKLSGLIHGYYAAVRIIDRLDKKTTGGRLALIKACSIVLESALDLLGVSSPEHM